MSKKRKRRDAVLKGCVYAAAAVMVIVLIAMIGYILYRGLRSVSIPFLTTAPSALNNTIGILPNILNTLYLILLTLVIVLPIGVGAAVYLTEYAPHSRIVKVIEATVETLAGIPSIIFGLVGMLFFCNFLNLQLSLLSGSLTMVILILPTIIRTTQESLKTVPDIYREGSLGLGSTKWYMIRTVVLPCSLDGIVTGSILAIGRIVGESAALLFTAGLAAGTINNIFEAYSNSGGTLSVALYMYVSERGKFDIGFAIAAILMIIVLIINGSTKLIQKRLKRKNSL
jgi:phosphate transport system permease protein